MEVFFGSQSDKTEQKHNEEKTMCLLKRLMFLSVLRFHFFSQWNFLEVYKAGNAAECHKSIVNQKNSLTNILQTLHIPYRISLLTNGNSFN